MKTLALSLLIGLLGVGTSSPSEPEGAAAPTEAAPASDPFAENACVNCHRDLPGRSSEIVELEWKNSVHYAAKTGCEGCHGGDPTLKPEKFDSREEFARASHHRRDPKFFTLHQTKDEIATPERGRSVSYFCGKCHSQITEKHLGSPHGRFGEPTCLYCHGQSSHLIPKATSATIDTRGRAEGGRCSPCHKATTMEGVAQVKRIVVETEERIAASLKLYEELEGWRYRNLNLEEMHRHTAEVETSKLRQVFHSFNMLEISTVARAIKETTERTTDTHALVGKLRKEQREQTLIGLVVALLLLAFARVLIYYRRTFLEKHPT